MERQSAWTTKARSRKSQTEKTIQRSAIGAALGAIIGAISGGGTGAAIGAAIGAGAGAGTFIVQGRDQLDLPRGTELTITSSLRGVRERQPAGNNNDWNRSRAAMAIVS